MHAHETHAHDICAHEIHAHEIHAREVHAHEIHTHELYAPETHTQLGTRLRDTRPEVHAHEMHARKPHAHEMHELGRCREIFDLSPSLPMSRHIGDALGAVFGAQSSAKGVIDPWGAMYSRSLSRPITWMLWDASSPTLVFESRRKASEAGSLC
jgi:hypothetical protein